MYYKDHPHFSKSLGLKSGAGRRAASLAHEQCSDWKYETSPDAPSIKATAICTDCGKSLRINTAPEPGEPGIFGTAFVQRCTMPEIEKWTSTTTNGEIFTGRELIALIQLIFIRFGSDMQAAHAAYSRLMQSEIDYDEFEHLVELGDHRSFDRLLHYLAD